MKPATLTSKIAGRFKLTVRRPDGTPRIDTPWQDNLVTNDGLERIGTGGWFSACHVGSGSTAPTYADAQLQTFVAGTTSVQTSSTSCQTSSPYFGSSIKTFRFAAGVAAGNLNEVGIASAAANGGTTKLITRALILDEFGSPTTVTVLSDEVLDVTYEMRLYPATEADVTGSIVISGVTYNYTIRPASITTAGYWADQIGQTASHNPTGATNYGFYNGAIGTITGSPSGSGASFDVTNAAYSANSKYLDASITLGLTSANLSGGIRSIAGHTSLGRYQIDMGAGIPKDGTKTLTLTFRIAWDRH